MQLDPKSTILGQPALLIRDVLKSLPDGDCWRPVDWDRHGLKLSAKAKKSLEAALVEEGYIEPFPASSDSRTRQTLCYCRTEKGTRIALASGRSYKRATVEKTLKGVIERATEINTRSDYYAYRIKALVVFGSYLTGAPKLGDLDLAIEKERLFSGTTHEEYHAWNAQFTRRAPYGTSFIERIGWGEIEVLRKLKGSSPVVSLHSTDDAALRLGPYQVVLGEWSPPEAPST